MFGREVPKALGLDLGNGNLVWTLRHSCTAVLLMPVQATRPLVVCVDQNVSSWVRPFCPAFICTVLTGICSPLMAYASLGDSRSGIDRIHMARDIVSFTKCGLILPKRNYMSRHLPVFVKRTIFLQKSNVYVLVASFLPK